jgi:hypothetical protein
MPAIGIEQTRTLLASIDTGHAVGPRDQAILTTLVDIVCQAGAVAATVGHLAAATNASQHRSGYR